MFDEEIQAWRQGPVVPRLWREHRSLHKVRDWPIGDPDKLSPTERETLDWVVRNYGHFSAERLSRMTHREPSARSPAVRKTDLRGIRGYGRPT